VHNHGNQHFFFLPPMVPEPQYTGTSDGSVFPEVMVCEWNGTGCGPVIAQYSRESGTGSEMVRYDSSGEFYIVNWHTDRCLSGLCTLDPAKTYRLHVVAGDRELGFADLDVVSSGSMLRNVQTDEYIGLIDGRTLPVKFRIETGVVAAITVTPATATIPVGGVIQFSATVIDLHGQSLAESPIAWSSSDLDVASVDGQGVASGVNAGTVTVTATADGLSTDATLTVEALRTGSYSAIDAGDEHTCALDLDGRPYCWGANHVRQLGIGTTDNAPHPTPILVAGDLHLSTLSTAAGTTCGLDAGGAAWCWGWGSDGQLGDGIAQGSLTPIAVAGGRQYSTLSTGHLSTCAITLAGAMYCWGHLFDISPWPIPGGRIFQTVAVGWDFACGITAAGAGYCLGVNDQGQFGAPGTPSYTLTPTAVSGGHTFTSLASGRAHTCALDPDGVAWCWGRGSEGQLGDGGFANHAVPTAVTSNKFRSLSAAGWSTCGVTTDRLAMCWGANDRGQVGDGTTTYRGLPTAIVGASANYISLQAGRDGGCAVTDQNEAYCWGFNGYGRLGDGTTSTSTVPVPVVNP
jgi:alpha-tubulin suppressor-like RCC1 family protein